VTKVNIGLVAHDAKKKLMQNFCIAYRGILSKNEIYATGTTGKLIEDIGSHWVPIEGTFYSEKKGPLVDKVTKLLSGPLAGDCQIGAMIAEGKIDVLIFFCDNLIMQGHYQDIGALSRLASLYNIAFATNRTTADMIVTSPLITDENYLMEVPDVIEKYKNRMV
jgi:methylglyoxal synthase